MSYGVVELSPNIPLFSCYVLGGDTSGHIALQKVCGQMCPRPPRQVCCMIELQCVLVVITVHMIKYKCIQQASGFYLYVVIM